MSHHLHGIELILVFQKPNMHPIDDENGNGFILHKMELDVTMKSIYANVQYQN